MILWGNLRDIPHISRRPIKYGALRLNFARTQEWPWIICISTQSNAKLEASRTCVDSASLKRR